MGIAAPAGTPVKAVAPGAVVSVGQLGTYGLTVILQHGERRLLHLRVAQRRVGAQGRRGARRGEAIGSVGVSDPDLKPHLHFEMRAQGPRGGSRDAGCAGASR